MQPVPHEEAEAELRSALDRIAIWRAAYERARAGRDADPGDARRAAELSDALRALLLAQSDLANAEAELARLRRGLAPSASARAREMA